MTALSGRQADGVGRACRREAFEGQADATEPSPIAATRLTEPVHTSPTANMPGLLVSRNNGGWFCLPAGRRGCRCRSRGNRACPRQLASQPLGDPTQGRR